MIFRLTYCNRFKDKARIEIKTPGSSTIKEVEGTENPFTLQYKNDKSDKSGNFRTSSAEINIYETPDFNIDTLKTSSETDIKVDYYINDVKKWTGYVIPDFFSREIGGSGVVSMVASDRISTLKGVTLSDLPEHISIRDLAVKCLASTGLNLPLKTMADFLAGQFGFNDFFRSKILSQRLVDNKGRSISCYDILGSILIASNSLLIQRDAEWYIINKFQHETGTGNLYSTDNTSTEWESEIHNFNEITKGAIRSIVPVAASVGIFHELGGGRLHPENYDFSKGINGWTPINNFNYKIDNREIKEFTKLTEQKQYIEPVYGEVTKKNYLLSVNNRGPDFLSGDDRTLNTLPYMEAVIDIISTDSDNVEILIDFSCTGPYKTLFAYSIIMDNGTTKYALNRNGAFETFDPKKSKFSLELKTGDGAQTEVLMKNIQRKAVFEASGVRDYKLKVRIYGSVSPHPTYTGQPGISAINYISIKFKNTSETAKGNIYKREQGSNFTKTHNIDTSIFGDFITGGLNGYFYDYPIDDTSSLFDQYDDVDLRSPSWVSPGDGEARPLLLHSVRQKARMFSVAHDLISGEIDMVHFDPLAIFQDCKGKKYTVVSADVDFFNSVARVDIEEIAYKTLLARDFIYSYFGEGESSISSVSGIASGTGNIGGGGGGMTSDQIAILSEVERKAHEHDNKDILDKLTQGMIDNASREMVTSDSKTTLSDENYLSSLRTLKEIKERALSRINPDTAQEHIIFEKGIESAFVLVEGDGTRDVDQGLTEGDIEASGEVTQSFTEAFQSTGGATTLGELLNVDETFDTIPDAVYSFKKQNGIFYPILGGGGGSTAKLTLSYISDASVSIVHGSDYDIEFLFSSTVSGEETGAGTVSYRVNGRVVGGGTIQQGSTRFNIGKFLILGDNTVTVTVTDSYGSSRTLTYNISAVSVSLNSTFNAQQIFTGSILFPFTPVGFGTMNIHIYLDGVKLTTVTTSASSKQLTYNIPAQPHGAHMIRAYMEIAGEGITSNELVYSIISVQSGNNTVIISSAFKDNSATQYDTILIPFMVYDPASIRTDIELLVNGEVISTRNVDRSLQQWAYSFAGNGPYSLVIRKGSVVKVFTFDVAESDIKDLEETERLQLKLLSAGRNNSESNRDVWEYSGIKTLFTGFNWNSDGWLTGDKGTSLRVSGDAKISIPFKIFSTDFKLNGKTIEFEFSTQDVTDLDYVLLSCMQGGKGFEITPQKATFKSEQTTLVTQFKENEHIRISIVVQQSVKQRLISMYINGKLSGVIQYPSSDSFIQASPVNITAQGQRATINIYAIRVYDTDLEHFQVLNNRIFDYPVASEKAEIYARNNILGADGTISYNLLANQLPVLTITGDLPSYKGDKKTCSVLFEDRQNPERSFTASNVENDVQGTSSQYYPRKNYKMKFKSGFDMSLTGEHKGGFQTHEHTLPATVFTHKADFAESSGTHNTGIAKVAEGLLKSLNILTPPQVANKDIRTTVDGFAMAVFHRKTENDPVTFLGKYNFNTDKAAENTFGFTSPVECWEVLNNTSDRVLFRVSDTISSDWENDYEGRFPDGNKDFTNLKRMTDWVVSCIGNPTKFKNEAAAYFHLDFLLSYYVITELFAMVDQRAKNVFWTSFDKTIWLPIFYDNDTCLGINNEGVNVFYFDVEAHDRIGTQSVWNGADSELWKLVEQAFPDEIKAMYQRIRKDDTLSYDSVLSILNGEHSDRWSETVYNEDGMYKYILPLIEDGNGSYLYAAQGSREEHRKWWLSNRFRYMDSKYDTGDFRDDFLTMRLYTPTGNLAVQPNADFIVDVFASQYIKAKWGSYETAKRVRVGEVTTFEAPAIQFNDTETILYGASYIRSLGDLSGKYAGTIDVSKATKLTELIIGSDKAGYQNTNLVVLHVGNNKLLRKIDIRNCPNLTGSLDLSGCDNIEEIYATGTGINGVELMSGGIVKTMQLPATITNLRLIGQTSLGAGLTLAGYDNLSSLRVEECPGVNGYLIAKQSKNLQTVRLIGIDVKDTDFSLIFAMTKMNGVDENGYITDKAVVTGKIHATNGYEGWLEVINETFPELKVTYDNYAEIPLRTIRVLASPNSSALTGKGLTVNGEHYTTNDSGEVSLYSDEKLTVIVDIEGYKPFMQEYAGSIVDTTNIILLDNLVTFSIAVKNQFGHGIPNVPVMFDGKPGYTNSLGIAAFTTSRGTYPYSVTYSGETRQGQAVIAAADVTTTESFELNIEDLKPEPDGSLQILVMPDPTTIRLSITGYSGAIVDWGDGVIEPIANASPTHNYTEKQFYNIKVVGASITRCLMYSGYENCLYAYWTIGSATVRSLTFQNYVNLAIIGNDLFKNDTARTSFDSCFYECNRLKKIPDGLFDNCVEATTFGMCFINCSSLVISPIRLFDKCTKVTNYGYLHYGCTSLVTAGIPMYRFDATKDSMFTYDNALRIIVCNAVTPVFLTYGNLPSTSIDYKVYVPDESVQAYKTASGWTSYASRIYPLSQLPE